MEQAVALFQKTESRLKVQRHQYQHQSRLESVNVAVQQKQKTCYLCKKPGHVQKDCWSTMTCGYCGKKGHLTERCRFNKGGGANKNAEVVVLTDGT